MQQLCFWTLQYRHFLVQALGPALTEFDARGHHDRVPDIVEIKVVVLLKKLTTISSWDMSRLCIENISLIEMCICGFDGTL